jgi:nitrogen fixation-related uncharacterized protein
MPTVVLLDWGTKCGEFNDNWADSEEALADGPSEVPSVRLFFRRLGEVFRLKPSLL